MSLKSEIERVMRLCGPDSTMTASATYDSRSRFVKNQTVNTHGLTRRNRARYYRNDRQDTDPTISLTIPHVIKYMQRKRDNSVLIEKRAEVKYADDDTLLLRVTCNIHPMTEGGSSRWSYDDADARRSLQVSNGPISTSVSTFLMRADSDMTVTSSTTSDNSNNRRKLLLGSPGESTMNTSGNKTIITDSLGKSITCIELRGANVTIWDDVSIEKIEHILNPATQEYVSPTFESEGFEDIFDGAKLDGFVPVIVKDLALWKTNEEVKLNSVSGKLTATLNTKSIVISCSIMKGSILTFTLDGKIISKDIPQGNYNILSHLEPYDNLRDYREQVLTSASEITIDVAVSRLDYLTVMDVEKSSTNKDTLLEDRVDYGANMDISKSKESVNTDKLIGRVSFVDLDED